MYPAAIGFCLQWGTKHNSVSSTRSFLVSMVPAFRCPELYYLENGHYIPNDHVPLLWTQANLMLAMKLVQENCH